MANKEKTKALLDKLSDGIKAIQTSDEFKAVLDCMANFHSYSWRNTILIHMQCPTASRVAGYRAWQKMGRQVRKGEKSISILAPGTWKREDEETGDVETGIYFFPVSVFDISQTDGDDLPDLEWRPIEDTHGEVLDKLLALATEHNIEIEFKELANCEGISKGGKVAIQRDKNPTEQALILIHELAHELLHKAEERTKLTTEQKELEAEATAYVVANVLGVPQTNSERYLALYHKSYDLKESLEAIHQTSQTILKATLSERYQEAA